MEWYWWILIALSVILVVTIGTSLVQLCWYWWVLIAVVVAIIGYLKIQVLRKMMEASKK